jgi:hypothetical protein
VQAEQQTFVEKGEGIPRNDEINQHCLANCIKEDADYFLNRTMRVPNNGRMELPVYELIALYYHIEIKGLCNLSIKPHFFTSR